MNRKPYLYVITIDGREVGEPYRSKAAAYMDAELLMDTSPWSVIKVEGVLK